MGTVLRGKKHARGDSLLGGKGRPGVCKISGATGHRERAVPGGKRLRAGEKRVLLEKGKCPRTGKCTKLRGLRRKKAANRHKPASCPMPRENLRRGGEGGEPSTLQKRGAPLSP